MMAFYFFQICKLLTKIMHGFTATTNPNRFLSARRSLQTLINVIYTPAESDAQFHERRESGTAV